ncbi:hypothetical protein [Sinomonas atrocyanea]
MPNLVTDLFEYDTESIIDFLVYPSGLKDGTVDHAVHVPMGHTTSGPASVYLQTSQFENGITSISILEQLHPAAASDIAAALRQAAATEIVDISMEEIARASVKDFVRAEVERAGKPILEQGLAMIPSVLDDVRVRNQMAELMEDLDKEMGDGTAGGPGN